MFNKFYHSFQAPVVYMFMTYACTCSTFYSLIFIPVIVLSLSVFSFFSYPFFVSHVYGVCVVESMFQYVQISRFTTQVWVQILREWWWWWRKRRCHDRLSWFVVRSECSNEMELRWHFTSLFIVSDIKYVKHEFLLLPTRPIQ